MVDADGSDYRRLIHSEIHGPARQGRPLILAAARLGERQMEKEFGWIGGVIAALIGLAIVAVIVGKNAQTGSVLTSAGQALSGVIGAAVAPVS